MGICTGQSSCKLLTSVALPQRVLKKIKKVKIALVEMCGVALHAGNPSTWEVSLQRVRRSSPASLVYHSKFKGRLNYGRPFLEKK